MNSRKSALDNLLCYDSTIRPGGLDNVLYAIDRDVGLPVPVEKFCCRFVPTASRWDGASRTVHLYEISSSEAFPDGTFEAIKDFAERLHGCVGCFTAMWITDGNGQHPLKVWDVRDELVWVR